MKLWILSTPVPASEDTSYLIGRTASRSAQVFISRVPPDAPDPPPPPEADIDIILNRSFIPRRDFLLKLDRIAAERGVLLTNPGTASARACDKRSYLEDFPDLAPRSGIARSVEDVLAYQEAWGGNVVLKDPLGKHGKDIILFRGARDRKAASDLLSRMDQGEVVAQEFCSGFIAGDKRIILHRDRKHGFKPAAWFKRVPKAGEWKSNVSAGGRIERCELENQEVHLAKEVAERAGLDSIGIDLAWHEGRCLLIETNAYTGGHIDFDNDRRVHSGDDFAAMICHLAKAGRP